MQDLTLLTDKLEVKREAIKYKKKNHRSYSNMKTEKVK